MSLKKSALIFATITLVSSCAQEQEDASGALTSASTLSVGTMLNSAGEPTGMVNLIEEGGAISLEVSLEGFEPGIRAIHLHEKGRCDPPEFKTAGGHLNPAGATHGELSDGGQHLGDLPNIEISAEGRLEQSIAIDGAAAEIRNAIFDNDGTSVMVHAGPDDYLTDPSGNAGPRIACAVLEPTG